MADPLADIRAACANPTADDLAREASRAEWAYREALHVAGATAPATRTLATNLSRLVHWLMLRQHHDRGNRPAPWRG